MSQVMGHIIAFSSYVSRSVITAPPDLVSVSVDVCIGYEFGASCRAGEIIVMKTAEFGRPGPGKCIPADRGNFGCKNDVLFLADMWCSGRKDCQFSVPNAEIMEVNTECVDLREFLRASYNCLTGTFFLKYKGKIYRQIIRLDVIVSSI